MSCYAIHFETKNDFNVKSHVMFSRSKSSSFCLFYARMRDETNCQDSVSVREDISNVNKHLHCG